MWMVNNPYNEEIRICPHCGKEYAVREREQTPGCRDWEEEICPYCGKIIRRSMEWEFYTYKL